jgi:hypothetical protein
MYLKSRLLLCLLPLFLVAISHQSAWAQSEVFGSGFRRTSSGAADGSTSFTHVAVNAWLDESNVAHGLVTYQGDVSWPLPAEGRPQFPGGPSIPWLIAVTAIDFYDGTTAYVQGVVVNSPWPGDVGNPVGFLFTDNSGTGDPDLLSGVPIEAGDYTVQ